jgi:hypothetical protein
MPPPSNWEWAWQKIRSASQIWLSAWRKLGIWGLSLIASLVLPGLPIGIEWLRTSHINSDTLYVTATVLAAAFIFSAEHAMTLCLYILLFLATLLLDTVTGPNSPVGLENYAGTLLGAVAFLHAAERFWWHVVLDRPFPDRMRVT